MESVERESVAVAAGYGLKLYVERGHLIIHDGVGRQRQTRRFHRATSNLKRVVVIGHTGFITLDALRWIRDTRAAFVQIDSDANLIALSAPARYHESKLRRAQVLAAQTEIGKRATVELFRAKLHRQAELVERLRHLKSTVRVKDGSPVAVADAIRCHAQALDPQLPFGRLREIESAAGRNYWQAWARVPVQFEKGWSDHVPEHWHRAGTRTSLAENKGRARKATSPVHALLNYTYAILETEATIAAHALGFDPSLGIMHTDVRYRSSLASDLMEPARPMVDQLVLDLLEQRELRRGDVLETREGVCRIGLPLARELAGHSLALRAAVAPHAEHVARTLLKAPQHATPLTREKHLAALTASRP